MLTESGGRGEKFINPIRKKLLVVEEIARGNTFNYVLQSLKSYIDFVVKKRGK